MSPAFNRSSEIQRYDHRDMIKIRDGIMFVFYPGLPHVHVVVYVCVGKGWEGLASGWACQAMQPVGFISLPLSLPPIPTHRQIEILAPEVNKVSTCLCVNVCVLVC